MWRRIAPARHYPAGVYYDRIKRKFRAYYYNSRRKKTTIGYFANQEDAAHAFNAAIKRDGLESRRKINPVKNGQLVAKPANKSRFYGVSWNKRSEKWIAGCNGVFLGNHTTEHAAARAVDAYLYKHRPDLAAKKANFPRRT